MYFIPITMKKPIIATTLSGLFVKHAPWDRAHQLWYKRASRILRDSSLIKRGKRKEGYFTSVDEIMKRIYPELSEKERTKIAREMYFDIVLKYIKHRPHVKNERVIKYFKSLKSKYKIALITTNTPEAARKILHIAHLDKLFDLVETSPPSEKDDKRKVFDRFIAKHGKPILYMGGNRKDSFEYCREHGIRGIFANFENSKAILGAKSVRNLNELKEIIHKL